MSNYTLQPSEGSDLEVSEDVVKLIPTLWKVIQGEKAALVIFFSHQSAADLEENGTSVSVMPVSEVDEEDLKRVLP